MISFRGLQQSTTGILCILVGLCLFQHPRHAVQMAYALLRYPSGPFVSDAFSVSITLMFLLPLEARRANQSLVATARIRQPWRHLWRSIFIFAANICFFAGLAVNDMGIHVAFSFCAADPHRHERGFLGEQVGWRRWSAIVVGLAGGLLIIKPTPDALTHCYCCPWPRRSYTQPISCSPGNWGAQKMRP